MKNYNKIIYRGDDKGLLEESPEWWDYWEEEIRRCIEGHEGLPGRYYFMLKFCKIKDVEKGWMAPWYLDFQHELIERIEYNDSRGVNTGVKKGRRKGYSYVAIEAVLLYDLIFNTGIECTWGVGDDETLIASRTNILDCFNQVHPFFYLNTLQDTKDLMKFGWRQPGEGGRIEDKGTLNNLYMELMSANTGVFKGKAVKRSIFEEVGKFKNLKQSFNDTKDCWRKGSIQVGTALLGGTGGAVDKGSRDFMYMVENAEEFNIDWYMIPAVKGYYPYVTPEGISQIPEATKHWEQEESLFKKKKNKRSLYDFYQNNPMCDEHIFLTLGSGVFNQVSLEDAEKLIKFKPQGIMLGDFKLIENWRDLYNRKGWCKEMIQFDGNVEGKIRMKYPPDYLGDDISGCDPYSQEKSLTSDSKGAMYIYRCTSKKHMYDGDRICMEYFDRPERMRDFHLQILYGILYYDTTLNFEANQSAELVSFFEIKKAEHLLDLRPSSFDSVKEEESKASNKYGRSINKATKPILVNSIAEYIEDHWMNIWTPRLIRELKLFGSVNTDMAMAFGIARLKALERYAITGIDFIGNTEVDTTSDLPFYKKVNGKITLVSRMQH